MDAGASFTEFAGYQMPVRYSSDLAEHHAVRTAAGLFDLSHMAEIIVKGPGAADALDFALAGKISAIAVGQAKYSLLLNPDGGIIDDVVVYRTHPERFGVVANAANRFAAAGAISARAKEFDATVTDESEILALVAIQGPASAAIIDKLPIETRIKPSDLKYYWSNTGTYRGSEILVGRTGYTGEDGFELYVLANQAEELWNEIMAAGAEFGIVPAGLASRDTLRLEAGMPLYGHELGTETFPADAGLGRVVNFTKPDDFVGRSALENVERPDARVLVGLRSEGKRAGRAGYEIFGPESDAAIGIVTSGALSPTLGYPIAMAYVDPAFSAAGSELFIDVRGTRVPASVTALPFYKREAK
ncbi:glycine cleavage system aminomethyltransferase GcvT [soil metagenome]